jgi:hypothetical protein
MAVRCSSKLARLGKPAVRKATIAMPSGAEEIAVLIFSLGFMV